MGAQEPEVAPRLRGAGLASLAALFATGLAAAVAAAACGGGEVAAKVSTAAAALSVTRTADTVTETQPAEIVTETQTVEQGVTVQETVTVPAPATTAPTTETADSGGTPSWVWVLVGLGAVGLVVLIVLLARGRRGTPELPLEERRQRVFATVSSWAAQGWGIESEADESAVVSRNGERVLITVDAHGHVTSNRLAARDG